MARVISLLLLGSLLAACDGPPPGVGPIDPSGSCPGYYYRLYGSCWFSPNTEGHGDTSRRGCSRENPLNCRRW